MTSAAVAFPAADAGPRVTGATALEVHLISEACDFFGVAEDGFLSTKRGYYSKARWAVCLVLVDHVGWSERRTAALIEKHHSVVQDGLLKARPLLRRDPLFFELVERLRQIVSPP